MNYAICGFLPFDKEGTILKDIPKLQPEFEKCKKQVLEKARSLNAMDEITEDKIINEEILLNIFDSKMIDLDNMVIETKVIDGKLYAQYYDENVLEASIEVQSDKTVKLKRKAKVFI